MSEDLPPWAKKLMEQVEAQKTELVEQRTLAATLQDHVNHLEGLQEAQKTELVEQRTLAATLQDHVKRLEGLQVKMQSEITTLQQEVAAQYKLLHPPNVICTPALRDPLTIAMSFMTKPQRFRNCCKFTAEVFNQAAFLEGRLACGVAIRSDISSSLPLIGQKVTGFNLKNIHSISLQHVTELETIGPNWMCGLCGNSPFLVKVAIKDCPQLRCIGAGFLSHCKVLEEVQLCNLPVGVLKSTFLGSCPKLKNVQIEGLPELHIVEDGCLTACAQLESLSFQDFRWLRAIGSDFAASCTNLRHLVFRKLPFLAHIGRTFFFNTALTEVRLEDLPQLSSIGEMCLRKCRYLQSVTFKGMPRLQGLGPGFLDSCPKLKELRFDNLPILSLTHRMENNQLVPSLQSLEVTNCPALSRQISEYTGKH